VLPLDLAHWEGTNDKRSSDPCADHAIGEYADMADVEHRSARTGNGRVLGWVSGLGIVIIPWIGSGIVSTFLPEPEKAFQWVLLVTFVAMIGWIAYGSVRIPRFRRGALLGSAIALGIVGLLYVIVRLLQP